MIITFNQKILEILIEFVVDINDPLLSLIHKIENIMIDKKEISHTHLVIGRELNRILEVVNDCLQTDLLPNYERDILKKMARKEG
tara:strand:- start:16 stop:270 length:255 start_codon:yes stop_codon:yes gene_type:complete